VREAYTTQYRDPIAFRAGDAIRVEQQDADYPGWYWCRAPDAKQGWVHESLLSRSEGVATALKDYSARELDVRAGDRGRVRGVLGGWLYAELDDGRSGWIPERVVASA
jgi:hypothetical protein